MVIDTEQELMRLGAVKKAAIIALEGYNDLAGANIPPDAVLAAKECARVYSEFIRNITLVTEALETGSTALLRLQEMGYPALPRLLQAQAVLEAWLGQHMTISAAIRQSQVEAEATGGQIAFTSVK